MGGLLTTGQAEMRQRLSVALVSPGWPLEAFTSGIVTYVAALEPALRALGHDVSILAWQVAAGQGAEGVYDIAAAGQRGLARRIADRLWYEAAPDAAVRGFRKRAITRAAVRMSRERALDVIEMEESFGLARWVQDATAVPVCVRLHGPYFLTGGAGGVPDDGPFRARVRAEGQAISAAAALSAPALNVLQEVRKFYGLELPDAEVIPNPVAPVPSAERWTLGNCQRKRIVYVGRFERLKGGDLIVEAFAQVLRSVPDATLTLVGPDGDCVANDGRTWRLADFVRSRLPGALESGQVEWLGQQPYGALAKLRRRALVSVVCSRYENFPYTVTEAMAMGCPIVAARVAGIPEVIRDGANGRLHEPGDADDLAAQLVCMLRAPEQAAEMGCQAAVDAGRTLHPEVVARRLSALYEKTIARHRASGLARRRWVGIGRERPG